MSTIRKTILILVIVGIATCVGVRTHQNKVEMHNSDAKKENHEQAQIIAGAVAEAVIKQAVENPAALAQVPTKFISGAIQGLTGLFGGAWNIKDRARSLQLTFSNLVRTNSIQLVDTYFDSGTWFQTWRPIMPAMSVTQGTVANRQGSWFTGVTGGAKLRILGTNLFIYIGFNNPFIGGFKFYGEISSSDRPAKYGYDRSSKNNPISTINGGYRLQVIQTTSSVAQMAFIYQISRA